MNTNTYTEELFKDNIKQIFLNELKDWAIDESSDESQAAAEVFAQRIVNLRAALWGADTDSRPAHKVDTHDLHELQYQRIVEGRFA